MSLPLDLRRRIKIAKRKYVGVVFLYVFLLIYLLCLFMSGIALRWSEGAIWSTIPAAILAIYMSYSEYERYTFYSDLSKLPEPAGKTSHVIGIHDVLYRHIRTMMKVGGGLVLIYALAYGAGAYQYDIVPEMLGGGLMLIWLAAFGYAWYHEPVFDLESVVLAQESGRLS